MKAVFYIVIDGLGDSAGEGIIRFLRRACLAKEDGVFFDLIPISPRNRPDVRKYIGRKIDQEAQGGYYRITTTLKNIGSLEYTSQIEQALNDAGVARPRQIVDDIESMNDSRELLTPRQMSAALYLKTGEASLLPLREKFQLKYPLFEIDKNGKIDFRSSEFQDLIPLKRRFSDSQLEQSPNAAQPGEVAMVRHFLQTKKTGSIYKDDPDTREAKMALNCLRVLTADLDWMTKKLLPYESNKLLNHLSSADLALADLPFPSGSMSHRYYIQTPKVDVEDLPEGQIPYGDQLVTFSEWLSDVQASYFHFE
ncbi:hypothetical protein BJX99DRAFT_262248 [Aspergillus californicus]